AVAVVRRGGEHEGCRDGAAQLLGHLVAAEQDVVPQRLVRDRTHETQPVGPRAGPQIQLRGQPPAGAGEQAVHLALHVVAVDLEPDDLARTAPPGDDGRLPGGQTVASPGADTTSSRPTAVTRCPVRGMLMPYAPGCSERINT